MHTTDTWFLNKGFFRISYDRSADNYIWIPTEKWTRLINAYFDKYPVYQWLEMGAGKSKKIDTDPDKQGSDFTLITPQRLRQFYNDDWRYTDGSKIE